MGHALAGESNKKQVVYSQLGILQVLIIIWMPFLEANIEKAM